MCMNTHHLLNQAFAVAEGYLANRRMVHCLVPIAIKLMIVYRKHPSCCTLTRINSNNDGKSIGAGMDVLGLLLAVTIITLIVQLIRNVTMIATMVLLIII